VAEIRLDLILKLPDNLFQRLDPLLSQICQIFQVRIPLQHLQEGEVHPQLDLGLLGDFGPAMRLIDQVNVWTNQWSVAPLLKFETHLARENYFTPSHIQEHTNKDSLILAMDK
jgi:hypothetical protein